MGITEYQYNGSPFVVTEDMKEDFQNNGYVIIRKLLDSEELGNVCKVLDTSEDIKHRYRFGIKDAAGFESAQVTWNSPGNDVTGMVARSEKVAGTAEGLLGGEIYHYHTKLVIKDPHTGGARAWHQDYGYWYKNGCLFPDMATVFIPVDKTDKSNGCLQVLRGSHHCGRIEHGLTGGEQGADPERVAHLKERCELDYVELDPGDAVFFHSNLLHYSAVNTSPRRRLAFLVAYNRASNDPVIEHHHPRYTPLKKVPDSAIRECTNYTDMSGKDFLDMTKAETIQDQVQAEK